MPVETLDRCEQIIGYSFSDRSLLSTALTHASVASSRVQSNERMEFLGDAVLGLVVCHELFRRYRTLLEGQLTKIKSAVVSREVCAEVAEESGLADLIFLGKGMGALRDLPRSVMAAVFEAIIGAVYLDGGLGAAREFVLRYIGPHIEDAAANDHQRNYKAVLQQHSQRMWGSTPEYLLLDEKGPDHSKCFEVAVLLNGQQCPSAWGTSKKQAEQGAAMHALAHLGLLEGQD